MRSPPGLVNQAVTSAMLSQYNRADEAPVRVSPVQRDVVQHLVRTEDLPESALVVRLGPHLLQDPGTESYR
jgi:hypothetical protein